VKQTLVLALVSLLAAVGAGTWYAVLIAPSPPTPVLATGPAKPPAPVAKAKSRPADSAKAKTPPADSAPRPTIVDSTLAKKPEQRPAELAPAALAERTGRAKAVGRILVGMKPKEAADILNRMPDDEVERIVRQLNAKQVATLLTALPDDRAAFLSRRLLQPGVRQ
jgi:MgtE intracellular N domain